MSDSAHEHREHMFKSRSGHMDLSATSCVAIRQLDQSQRCKTAEAVPVPKHHTTKTYKRNGGKALPINPAIK
jgi:hypothetical protein